MKIKCIKIDGKLPEGYRYISSWEVEKLICKNFKAFKNLELSIDVGYYKIKNKDDFRYLWLARLDYDSQVNGSGGDLNVNYRVRGVLICKK